MSFLFYYKKQQFLFVRDDYVSLPSKCFFFIGKFHIKLEKQLINITMKRE